MVGSRWRIKTIETAARSDSSDNGGPNARPACDDCEEVVGARRTGVEALRFEVNQSCNQEGQSFLH